MHTVYGISKYVHSGCINMYGAGGVCVSASTTHAHARTHIAGILHSVHMCVCCVHMCVCCVQMCTYLCVTGACCTQCAYIYGICVYVCVPEMSMCVLEMCVSPGGCAYYKQCAYVCVNVCVCVNQKCLCVYEKGMCV